jgi:hypothetical protein
LTELLIIVGLLIGLIGLLRPGLLVALSAHAYNFEVYFDDNATIGIALGVAVPAYALIYTFFRRNVSFHLLDIVLLVFTFIYAGAAIRSAEFDYAMMSLAKFIVMGVGFYLCSRVFIDSEERYAGFVKDFAVGFVILAGLFGFAAEPDVSGTRTAIGEGTAVGLSAALNASLCIVLFYLMGRKNWRVVARPLLDLLLAWTALALLFYAAYLNGTRGALLGPLGAVVFYVVATVWWRLTTSPPLFRFAATLATMAALAGLTVMAAGYMAAAPEDVVPERLKYPILSVANAILGEERFYVPADVTAEDRLQIYRQAWEQIDRAPLVGSGVSSFQEHNVWLELWSEAGLGAVVVFAVFIGWSMLIGARQALSMRPSLASTVMFGAALGYLVQMQVSMTFAQAKILFLALGCFITVRLIRDRIRRRKRQPRAGEADVRPMTPQPAAPVVIPAAGSQPPTQAAE